MLKAFTPVAVLIFSVGFGLEKPSFIELVIVSLICIGVAITTVGETLFSWTGFTLQTLAIGVEASRLVLTGVTLKELKLDSLSTLYYISPLCLCCILPAHLYFEFSSLPWDIMLTSRFAGIMVASGAVAFGLNIAVVALINNKSALVLTLAGIIKDILLVVLSVLVFGSPVTPLQYFGYSVALLGLNAHKEYKKSPETAAKTVAALFPCCPKWCAT
jgi:drug/metabolite transporter (DMT)-like permease